MKVGTADVDAVIFDFDGTLADSMWVWDDVDHRFLEKRDIPYAKDYAESIAVLGFELGAQFTIEHFGLDESPEDIIEEWKQLAQEAYAEHVTLKPGAKEYLQYCKDQGVPMAIATSLQRHLLEPALKNNGIYDLFDVICICDELQCGGKSNPTVYLEAAHQLGVAASDCAVFEDVVTAARSAKEAGAYVVGVYDEHEQQVTEELKEIVDLFVISFEDLLVSQDLTQEIPIAAGETQEIPALQDETSEIPTISDETQEIPLPRSQYVSDTSFEPKTQPISMQPDPSEGVPPIQVKDAKMSRASKIGVAVACVLLMLVIIVGAAAFFAASSVEEEVVEPASISAPASASSSSTQSSPSAQSESASSASEESADAPGSAGDLEFDSSDVSPSDSRKTAEGEIYTSTRFGFSIKAPKGFIKQSESKTGDSVTFVNEELGMEAKAFGYNNGDAMTPERFIEKKQNGSLDSISECDAATALLYQTDEENVYFYLAYVGSGSVNELDITYPKTGDEAMQFDAVEELIDGFSVGDIAVAHK